MSYILEALKKAQAERQLGETPGIHTPTLDAPASAGAPLRKPLVAAIAVMAVVIVGLAAVVWRQAAAPAQPAQGPVAASAPVQPTQAQVAAVPVQGPQAPVTATSPAPAAQTPVVAAAPAPAEQAPVGATAPAQGEQAQAAAVPAQRAQGPVAAAGPAQPVPVPAPAAPVPATSPLRVAQSAPPPPPAVAKAPEPPARVAVAPARAPEPAKQSTEPAGEEPVQALRDLPEPIRRAVPPVAMSGYLYSPNPADRLILIDKVLRREGDEVAPGLVLERLEPKGAVFAFRGYRFRMPY